MRLRKLGQRGYIMLPVMFTLVLVATIAFMMNHEAGMGARSISSELEAAQARYVAEAGLQHALWQTEQQGCGPYTDITSQAFANDSYTTSLTTDLGGTTSYSITVDQDGWIDSDRPDDNHDTDSNLKILFDGGKIQRPIYRYDLSSLPADAAILSAKAWFYVNIEHPEGPVDIHRLTADWNEADATWATLGGGMDSVVLASIPAQPEIDVWVSVNLTAQVQAWVNGQPNYGIALNSVIEMVDGEYASREDSQQPYLTVMVGTAPSSPASLKSVGTLANGTRRSITRNDVALYQQPAGTMARQPTAIPGTDAYIWAYNKTTNYGGDDETWVATDSNNTALALFKFDLAGIPAGANITRAILSVYHRDGNDPDVPISAHRITNAWNEDDVTWEKRDIWQYWNIPGGDFDPNAVTTILVGPSDKMRYEWELTGLVQGWHSGQYENFGAALRTVAPGIFGERFDTSDHADPTHHPRLTITYSCACGQACLAPQGSGNILMVVSNEWDMTAGEKAEKSQFESWGYTVNLISQWDVSWNYDAMAANNDVVYVSEAVDSTTWDMAPKLAATSLGVVNEEGELNDELGIALGSAWPVGNTLTVTDSSHYITLPFAPGDLQIFSGDMEGLSVSGTQAGGLQSLADMGGEGGLVVLDTGTDLYGGGTAPGRRVMLPIGRDSGDFNWDYLNNNGRLLVQRAIEWAMNKQPAAPTGSSLWLSTLDDVSGSGAPGLDAWTDGEVISFADPNLVFEPGTTDGTFSSVLNLDDFGNGADIDALHYVGSDITVGGAHRVNLLVGDLLLSTADDETLTSLSSISVKDEDVFVFRPLISGDYSTGNFIYLLDGSELHAESDTVGISLVEKATLVGNHTLAKGSLILATTDRQDVQLMKLEDVGLGTTVGTSAEFIDGPSLNFGSEVRGMELAEDEITLGGHSIPAGSILLTLNNDLASVGDNAVAVDSEDIFYLTVAETGSSPVADATLLFDGSDLNLDTSQEHIQALTLTNTTTPSAAISPLAHWKLDETTGTMAVDSVGGHDGTVTGAEWTAGKIDGALAFDTDNILVPHDDTLALTEAFTLVAWVNSDAFGSSYQTILQKGRIGTNQNYWFGTWQRELVLGFFTGGAFREVYTTGLNLQTDNWYQLAATFDNANDEIRLYVNGVEVLSTTTPYEPPASGDDLVIGRSQWGEYWQGRIDDIRIYDSILSGTQVTDLYVEGGGDAGGTIDPPPDEGSCNGTFRDEFSVRSFGNNNGTLNWSSNWLEVGESDGAISGDVHIMADQSNYQLRIRDNDNGGEGVERVADLSGATLATLTFDYRRMNLDTSSDYVAVYLSSTGTAGPWTLVDYIGTSNDSSYQSYSRDISAYISANTAIRLRSSSSMGSTDTVWFDNIQIQCGTL